jgi:hypothetical protein
MPELSESSVRASRVFHFSAQQPSLLADAAAERGPDVDEFVGRLDYRHVEFPQHVRPASVLQTLSVSYVADPLRFELLASPFGSIHAALSGLSARVRPLRTDLGVLHLNSFGGLRFGHPAIPSTDRK